MEACPPLAGVELEPGRARIAVARLPDRAGIEEPATVELKLRPHGGETAVKVVISQPDRQRDVAVSDEHEGRLGREQAEVRRFGAEHVLPDGIARARVEELRALRHGLRLEAGQE